MEKELPPAFLCSCYVTETNQFLPAHQYFSIKKGIRLHGVLLCFLLFTGGVSWGQTTYTWNQTGTASWAMDVNWTPARTTPATNDILVFNNGATTTATNVPAQTIGSLQVLAGTKLTLTTSGVGATITINNGVSGFDLTVATGCQLNIAQVTNNTGMIISLATTATGSISGSMDFSSATATTVNQFLAADASAVTFNSGAVFTQNTNSTGSVFGTTGTANTIVLASGATFIQFAGSNPFGLGQPNSKVVFQTGSLFKHQQSGTPAFSGRTYADFEFNSSSTITVNGGAAASINNFIIDQGTFNYNMTGIPGHAIKGNITIANGATLNMNSITAARISLNGSSVQTISNSGAFSVSSLDTILLTHATNTILSQNGIGNFSIAGVIRSFSGTTPLTITGAGGGRVDIINFNNSFTGTITLTGAETRFSRPGCFGNTNNTIVVDGGRLATASDSTYTITSSHNIQVSNAAGSAISVTTSGVLTYNGIITDKPSTAGILVKQGAGALALGGINTYTGSTTINQGILQLTTGNDRLPTTTTLNIGQAASANLGTLDLNGFNQAVTGINSIAGTNATIGNNTINSTAAATMTINGSGSYSFGDGSNTNSGIITGAISIIKNGSGTQTFGDANTYTGTTSVNQGQLIINGIQAGTGAVSVAGSATLGGSGTIPGTVSLSGIISPGNSPGTLTTGAFTFNANSTYKFEISNATGIAGTDWDKIVSSGVIDVSGSPITIDLTSLSIINFNNAFPYTWVIASGASITGFNAANFIIDATNFLPPLGGGAFSITQTGNDINIVFSATAPPVLTTPTATAITTSEAVLGATITYDGGSAITERGTVYKTTAGVTAADNPLAEGGTSTGTYSHLRNGLNPETQYFYAGYAINASGTGLSPEANFRTLSNPPTSEASNFIATTISSSQIDMSWTVATFPVSGATANGYIILRRQDATDPTTTGIVNATAPGSLSLPSGTVLAMTVTSGSTSAFSDMGLTFSTQYNYLIVPFTWDGTNAATYNYYLPSAPTANATTLAGLPVVTSPTVTNISATSADLGANVTTDGGNALLERGTVYKTTTGVTITDNPLAEGGTSTGVFSHTRSSLNPETQYFFKGYATNSNGPALSSESSFYTFSAPPTSEATGFSGAPISSSEIDLSWTAATFPGAGATATGYVILRRSDSTDPSTTGFVNGSDPASFTLPAGTTLVTVLSSGATVSFNDTGLSTPGGQYNYLIVPFTWDNVHSATYNYYLPDAATAFASTIPGIPSLNNPTAISITESSAVLGANITSNNGGTLSERGTVYTTSTPVAITDNPLAEGGTGIGLFSHLRNSLSPETQYFYAGYAINAGGTGMSEEGNFRTLSNPPTSAAGNLVAVTFSNSQIDLSWSVATFPASGATATGYIILRKTGSDPATTGIVNATAPASLPLPVGTTLVTTITSGTTNTYSNTGLAGSTQYNYLIIPFTWDGVNAGTYNYYLINGPTANATTSASPPIVWTNTGASITWYTNTNWTPNTSSTQWATSDVAQFQNNGTATQAAINMNTGSLNIGAIEVTSARILSNLTIGNNSTTVDGTLTLNGVAVNVNANTILRNGSGKNLTLQDAISGGHIMNIVLGNATNNNIYLDGAGNITISNIITGTGKLLSLNGVGSGILTLSAVNTFSGGFTLDGATVSAANDAAYGTGALTLNGGILSASGIRTISNAIIISGNFGLGGAGTATYTSAINLGATSRTITISSTGGSTIFSGIISGAVGSGITFNGSGTGPLYLGASNTFTGDININGAEVGFPDNTALGDLSNSIILDGGRITSATTAAGAVTAVWSSTHNIQLGATAGTSINVQGGTGDLTYNGIVADKPSASGILVKQGAGILRLGGVSTYSGATTINAGTVQITTGNDRLPIGTTLNLGQASSTNLGLFDLNGFNQQIAGLNSISGTNATSSNNTVTSTGATTLTFAGSGAYSYGAGTNANSGVITGDISIIKNGSGSQTFGDANTYTGATDVNEGSLIINGIQTGTGAVTVASGATLGGSGILPGIISMSGIISPGNSTGTINTGAFAFQANSTYKFEISNATGVAGTDWDKINSSGTIDVSASPITIDLTSLSITNFDNSNSYTWIIASGTSIAGFNAANFIINTTNFLPPLAGGTFTVSQTGNDLNIVYSSTGFPVLIAPTFASITNTDAILGATITNQGSSALTARGTVYATIPGVTDSDNPLAEGGTSIGVYSHLRSGLNPETQYFFAGYATNNSATSLSPEANFRTLSNPPINEATGFTATTFSSSQINLNWTVSTFPISGATASGYVILRREDATNPTTSGIVNATAPSSLTLPSGTTLTTTITAGSTNTFSNTGLMPLTQYNFLIVPFTWDGVNEATYNYYLPNAPTAIATTLPLVPTLNDPTVSGITENSAVLGATVLSNNGSTLTERGTVYKTSSPVATTDNALAEGGTALGTFSHTRNALAPETQYFYAGYATNAGGTGLSGEGNFYTLSNSPTSEATNFIATPSSATQIDLTWTIAGFPMSGASATGYIILRKNGVDPATDGIIDANAPASLILPGGTTLVTTITSGATNSYSNTGLTAATQYNYLIVPFTWDGVNDATYNYYLDNAPVANATTPYLKQTFAADGSAFSASKWSSPSSTSCDIASQTNAFSAGNVAYFCTPSGTGIGSILTLAGITATESFSLTSATGNISTVNNGVIILDIASGKTVDFISMPFSNQATAGYIKNGGGTFAFVGGIYGGGFTLNGGTIIARNANAMGSNPNPGPLNLNAGTVAASATLNFSNKYSGINFDGDIQFGSTTAPANGAATLTFNSAMSLGSPMRTVTLGGSGAIVFGGVISNTSSNGIAFTAIASGTGRFDITNAANTFTGPININGDGGTGVAEARFSSDGSLGNTSNTININGGRFSTLNNASYTLTSSRGIQVGNTAGTAISTTGTGTLTYNGVMADLMGSTPGSWLKQGAGTLSLGGVSTYTGSTTINNGTLLLNAGNDRLPVNTTVNMGQASSTNLGTFNLNGFNQQIAGLNSISGTNASANNNTVTSANPATLTLGGSGSYSFGDGSNASSGVVTGTISIVKNGIGTQTLGDDNSYTGNTTITNGELRFNPSVNASLAGSLIMNGGILGTSGIADTRTLTFASFDLSDHSIIDLSTTSDHTITFTIAGTFTSGKTLTIFGWQGMPGTSGTKGKIFFGNSSSSLTPDQLMQIQFNDGSIGSPGTYFSASILSTGEVVVGVVGCGATVLNANDSGSGSLRDVIACVAPGGTITFDASLMGSTITLTTGEIEIDKNLTISGLGSVSDLVLSGNSASRIFHVAAGKILSLQNLSLKNSNAAAPFGGAVYVQGSLTLQNMLFQNNFENGITPKGITVNSPAGLITIIGANVQIKE